MAVALIIGVPFVLPFYGDMLDANWQNMQAIMEGGTPPANDAVFSTFGKMMPFYLPLMFAIWAVTAAGETAFYKRYFHGYEAPRQPLRFGSAELRTMMVQLGVYGCVFLGYFLGAMVIGIIAGVFGAISPILAAIVLVPGIIVILCLLPYLAIRLAPAAALSVDADRAHVLATFKITKHRFWWLFLAYLVTYVGGYILFYIVYFVALIVATGDPEIIMALSGLGEDSPKVLFEELRERFKSPLFMVLGILAMIIISAGASAWILFVAGVNAYAVRWWKGDDHKEAFD